MTGLRVLLNIVEAHRHTHAHTPSQRRGPQRHAKACIEWRQARRRRKEKEADLFHSDFSSLARSSSRCQHWISDNASSTGPTGQASGRSTRGYHQKSPEGSAERPWPAEGPLSHYDESFLTLF